MAYTWPAPAVLSTSDAEALNATTHTRSLIAYLGYGVGPNSSPSLRVQQNRIERLVREAVEGILRRTAVCFRHASVITIEAPGGDTGGRVGAESSAIRRGWGRGPGLMSRVWPLARGQWRGKSRWISSR